MGRSVVITAMGVISSLGDSAGAIAASLQKKAVAFEAWPAEPRMAVAPVKDFDVRRYTGRHKNLRYLNRGAAMAVAAAAIAVRQAKLSRLDLEDCGLFAGAGPNLDLGGECQHIQSGKMAADQLTALWILRFLPNTAASAIAQLVGLHGENGTLGSACAASLQALGEAFRKIRHGDLDVAVAGGGDSRLSAGAMLAYQKAQALYCGDLHPSEASRPFDRDRKGFVPGEGAAFFVLESEAHAAERCAPVLAEICGYGASMDGHAMTAPQPRGAWAERAVHRALADAAIPVGRIDMVSAHGTGTPLNDEVEAAMLDRVFSDRKPLILAIKSWIGHLASACGAVELAVCCAGLGTGIWPFIRNLETPCLGRLNYVRGNIDRAPDFILLQNFGFGGQNAALVIRSWKPS